MSDMSGKDLHTELFSLEFPDSTEGNHHERAVKMIQKLRSLLKRGESVRDPDYPTTQAMLVQRFVDVMPPEYIAGRMIYRRIKRTKRVI